MDLVLVANVLFHAKNKNAIIREANRVLKKGGKLLVVDWAKSSPIAGKITKAEVKNVASKLKFQFDSEVDAGEYHYGLVFKKT